jgi:ribonucleoside-diphosphate reductase alpha chain
MAGVRTSQRQFSSSCVLIETDDSLDSINATASSIVRYVSQKAGIGINAGRIRAIKSPIRKGDAYHTGVIPFFKMFQAATRSCCSQGGVRNGAATLYYPIWHLEAEDLLVLKNNKGTDDNRVRHMDYGVQFNKLMYEVY